MSADISKEQVLVIYNVRKWSRNKCFAGDFGKCAPDEILETTDSAVLGKWLTLYVAETRMSRSTLEDIRQPTHRPSAALPHPGS